MSCTQLRHRWLHALLLVLCVLYGVGQAHACTTTSSATIDLGSMTSFEATTAHPLAGSGSSGLSCPGILGLLNSQYVYLSVDYQSDGLINSVTGDKIPFQVVTLPGATPIPPGTTSGNLAGASLLSLGGLNGEVQLYVSLGEAGNIAAGTYTGTLQLRWHYAVCTSIGAIGECLLLNWTRSPGITENCISLLGAILACNLNLGTLPGSGSPVDLTITLEITRDCRFDADDIDFGAAPFVDSFEPVTGTLHVRCTKGSTYTLGLSNGNYFANGRRRMASGANRLEYDIFHSGGLRWNDTTNRAVQPVPAQGDAFESFIYEARIYEDQTTPPVGLYQDVVIIDVQF
jgi:spore coat protein U-like protein